MSVILRKHKDSGHPFLPRFVTVSFACFLCTAGILVLQGCRSSSGEGNLSDLYMQVLALFDKRHPGLGLDVYFTTQEAHHPKAYALFASAEALRFCRTWDTTALNNAIAAAQWLVENSDLDVDGEIGWGFPFPWDAGGDGSVNPADTEYTIDTAFAIQALLDVYEVVSRTKAEGNVRAFLETAVMAAETFARGRYDKNDAGIVFWYSTLPEDSYHVLNVSAMLAGQLQRLSRYDVPNAQVFSQLADQAVQYILAHMQRMHKNEFVYWLYYGDKRPTSVMENRPNDLQHEVYVIQGLLDYKRYGGRYGDHINLGMLLTSLSSFVAEDKIYEFPQGYPYPESLQSAAQEWARVWGLAYAVHVVRQLELQLESSRNLSEKLALALTRKYRHGNSWFLRPTSNQDISHYPRQLAFVLMGLASQAFTPCK